MRAERATFGLTQASGRWWVVLLVLVGASLYTYRARDSSPGETARISGPAQGTTYNIVLGGPRPAPMISALQRSVDSLLAEIDSRMSTYVPESELMRFNRNRSTSPLAVSPSLADVLQQSLAVSAASGGAFDVTVGPLVDAWGFGALAGTGRVPHDSTISQILARVGWQKLQLAGHMLSKTHPDVEIDLSGIAPGYTVDLISDLLAARGESNHFIELGGEVRARGRNASGQAFRVGIEEPVGNERNIRHVIGLSNRSLATSGNYRDFQDIDGVRYAHILDPSTGNPVRHNLLSVTVLHESCALADAWATALFVVGPERAWNLARDNGLEVLLLTSGARGNVEERMTDGFKVIVLPDRDRRN